MPAFARLLSPVDSVADFGGVGSDFSHALRAASKFSQTCLPNGSPPISPSSGNVPDSTPDLSVCFPFPFAALSCPSLEGVCAGRVARGATLTTEQSAYSAPGFKTSTVNSSVSLLLRASLLNGVGTNNP